MKYLFISLMGIAIFSCRLSPRHPMNGHFVSIKGNKFFLEGKEFFPLAVNYLGGFRADKNQLWPCPSSSYMVNLKDSHFTKDTSLMALKADMELIKSLGFNSIRLVGMDVALAKDGRLVRSARMQDGHDTLLVLSSNEKNYTAYFNALEEVVGIAGKAGLKIVFLNSVFHEKPVTEEHLKRLLARFQKDSTIMAYDLFNEPLYFDSVNRTKDDVYEIVRSWKKIMHENAPDQLSTIGLEGIREVFKWDPNILDVDFLSMHPYEYEPEQVRNELYWYGKYIKKPWIVGETAIPADDDSVPYERQRQFARKTLQQACNCGAMGYSWWQYKDVDWKVFYPSFMGVVSRKGETKTADSAIYIEGTPKPISGEFQKFRPWANKDSCLFLDNYYNYSNHKKCRIVGRLVSQDNEPLPGGVILAWNQWWSHSYHTVTKDDGSFELLGDFPFYHWMASATMYSMVRNDILPDSAKTGKDGIPTINIGILKLKKLWL